MQIIAIVPEIRGLHCSGLEKTALRWVIEKTSRKGEKFLGVDYDSAPISEHPNTRAAGEAAVKLADELNAKISCSSDVDDSMPMSGPGEYAMKPSELHRALIARLTEVDVEYSDR